MKLYVIMKRNELGKYEPAHGRGHQSFAQLRAFDSSASAKKSMIGLKATWPGDYKIVTFGAIKNG